MKSGTNITIALWMCFAGRCVWAAHGGPFLDITLEGDRPLLRWDNAGAFVGTADDRDPAFGRTLDVSNTATLAPAFRFSAGTIQNGMNFSFSVITPLVYWDHLLANPRWDSTHNGQFMELLDDGAVIAVVTDGVSAASPPAMRVAEHYAVDIHDGLTHGLAYLLSTPDGSGGRVAGGSVGAYGFGVRVHLWQEEPEGTVQRDFSDSQPVFLAFRNRPLGGSISDPPAGWMSQGDFAVAIAAGQQLLVPEPAGALICGLAAVVWVTRRPHRGFGDRRLGHSQASGMNSHRLGHVKPMVGGG